jgi:hypothetical protein
MTGLWSISLPPPPPTHTHMHTHTQSRLVSIDRVSLPFSWEVLQPQGMTTGYS